MLSGRQHTVIVWGLAFWLLLMPFSEVIHASTCEDFPTESPTEWESYPKYEGYYQNCPYGYAITIPEGFVGRGEAPSHTEHGFGILLSRHPHGYIWVDGSTGSAEVDSFEQAGDWYAEEYLTIIKEGTQKILSVQKEPLVLNELPAIRLIVRFICPNGAIMVEDYFIVAYQTGFEYTIALSADDATYQEYKPILEQLVETFRLIDEPCK